MSVEAWRDVVARCVVNSRPTPGVNEQTANEREKSMRMRATLLAAGILAVTTPLSAQERSVSLEAQDGLTLTLYQNDLGLVHDNRWVPLVQGENQLAIAGVSERLIGGSLSLDAGETKLQ